ncbi:TPA: capsule biosynthesis protein, partial [Mannheimia haemolytica]|nr:capsule biosynthesis protein [Mannheimia haemolytica]HDL6090424.1 capsule biosynthesis protein [Mannheimia haemolytica]
KLSSLNKIMDFSITQEDWYRSVTETQRNCVLIKNSAIEDYSINLTANKIQAKNSPIFIADPFNVLYIDDKKLLKGRDSLLKLVYKTSPYLGV